MKRFLRAGEGYALSGDKFKYLKLLYISLFTFFVCFIAGPSRAAGADTVSMEIKPLQIGDPIPDDLWHLPLQVVNHPEGKETITLADYKGKLIILDFWATWCAPCIEELPDLLRLEDSLTCKILPLSNEPVERLEQFLSNREDFPDSELYSFQRGSLVDKAFRRSSIPHTVVIHKGIVHSITIPRLLDHDKLSTLLRNGASSAIPQKVELEDLQETLLFTALQSRPAKEVHYTVLIGEIEGMVPKMRWASDTANVSEHLIIANYSLHSILAVATQRGDVFLRNPNRIMVKDGVSIRTIKENELQALKESKLSYEGVYPAHTAFESAVYRLGDDLRLYKGIAATVDTLPIDEDVYIFIGLQERRTEAKQSYSIKQVLSYLNQRVREASVSVDQRYENENVHLDADLASINPDDVEKMLLSQGWEKRRYQKETELLVLHTSVPLSKGGI